MTTEKKTVRFRNYVPKSTALFASLKVVDGDAPSERDAGAPQSSMRRRDDDDEAVPGDAHKSSDDADKDAFAVELEKLEAANPGEGVTVVPRSPTWDLKRDLEPRLAVLSRRTRRAIVDLIRARLAGDDDDDDDEDHGNSNGGPPAR